MDDHDDMGYRVEEAKIRAHRIFDGEYIDEDEALCGMYWVLARHYNRPLVEIENLYKHKLLDDLVCEIELIKLSVMPKEHRTQEIFQDHQKELSSLADEWEAEDNARQAEIDAEAARFFESGQFK